VMLQWLPDVLLGYEEWFEAVLAWLLFFIFWLPLAAAALLSDRSLWKPALRAWRCPHYWLGTLASAAVCSCALVGLLTQTDVIHWLEGAANLNGEMLVILALVYAIVLGAWLMILALVEEAIAAPELRSLEDTWD